MKTVIEISGLSKRFGNKTAVDGLDLEVPRGAIYALLGDNGAGKTTTIRMLTGLLKPDGGRATILGHDCWHGATALRQSVGYVPERPRFYDWMTVSELGWFASGFQGEDFYPRFLKHIEQFNVDPRPKLGTLSKGQYAKVALALALGMKPEVLILDEPTSGLDLFVRKQFLSSMVKQAGKGRTILISTHQIAEVERIASHVAFISGGKLLLAAPMDELKDRVVRLRLRYDRHPPESRALGTVLQRNGSGRQWQAVIQDPNRQELERLRERDDIFDFEEAPLGLEELYAVLLGEKEEDYEEEDES